MSFLIGTASWTDKTLIEEGDFYPADAKTPEARLRHYASVFPIVEVDSTYYFPPNEKTAALWATRTPTDFTFHIKAYSLLTQHPTRPESIYKDLREMIPPDKRGKRLYAAHLPQEAIDEIWSRFADALMPLHSAGKLGVVHMQFPEWFIPGSESRNYIVECKERLQDFKVAVEFRNASWLNDKNIDRTLSFLESQEVPVTSVDMPQGFKSSMPPIPVATSPALSYVRFHGRNVEQWEGKHATATPRFAYLYSEQELREWVPKLQELAERSREVHILMNNCYRDHAVNNARQLADLLR